MTVGGGVWRALVVSKAELQPLTRSPFQIKIHLISCMQGSVCPCWFFHKNTLHLNLDDFENTKCFLERENWPRFSRHGGNTTVQHALITYSLFVTPNFCISIVFSFSWELKRPQEKLKTMLMQNLGVKNKEYYGMFWYFLEWSITELYHSRDALEFCQGHLTQNQPMVVPV